MVGVLAVKFGHLGWRRNSRRIGLHRLGGGELRLQVDDNEGRINL
jgi:hypothetical protein